jgi:hypothetical protein
MRLRAQHVLIFYLVDGRDENSLIAIMRAGSALFAQIEPDLGQFLEPCILLL